MLIINLRNLDKSQNLKQISIHLMLLINIFIFFIRNKFQKISIHLMLLINLVDLGYQTYIKPNFNTSNVINQHGLILTITVILTYFNTSNVIKQHVE